MRKLFFILFLINLTYAQSDDKKFEVGLSYGLSHDSFLHDNPLIIHGNVKIYEFDFFTLKSGLKVYYFPLKNDLLSIYFSSQIGFNPQIVGTKTFVEDKLYFNLAIGYYYGSFDNIISIRDDLFSAEQIINAKVRLNGITFCPEFRFNINQTFHLNANYTYINTSLFKNDNSPSFDYNLINLGIGFSF